MAFSCIHCGAVLIYNKGPLDTLLWGTSLRRVFTVLGGWALLSGISLAVGKAVTLAAVAVLAAVLSAAHFVSARPAYKVADRGQPGNDAQL